MITKSALPTESEINQTFDRLYSIMQSDPFLQSKGIGNEVPLYIQPYAIEVQDAVDKRIRALHARLQTEGQEILRIHLLELVAEITSPGDRLKRLLEKEPSMPRPKMLSAMTRWTDASNHIVPAIKAKLDSNHWDATLIHGCGSVFPFLRTHGILETLQKDMNTSPIVFFFPGAYQHRDAAGSDLRLFDCLSHKGYYRAFNLDHYHL
jgi:hypothetical protein